MSYFVRCSSFLFVASGWYEYLSHTYKKSRVSPHNIINEFSLADRGCDEVVLIYLFMMSIETASQSSHGLWATLVNCPGTFPIRPNTLLPFRYLPSPVQSTTKKMLIERFLSVVAYFTIQSFLDSSQILASDTFCAFICTTIYLRVKNHSGA